MPNSQEIPENAIIIDPAELGDVSEAELEENENLQNLLADLGELDNVKVTVYRVKEGNKLAYVDAFAPSELDLEALMSGLRDQYQGGKFKIQVRESGRIKKSKIVEIEPPPEKTEADPLEIARQIKSEQQNESNGMATVLAEMIKANAEASRHQADQMQNFMATMITALAGNNNQPAAPAINPIEMQNSMVQTLVALKTMAEPAQAAKGPTDLILEGVKLVNEIRGSEDGGNEANMYSVLQKAIGEFGGALTSAQSMVPPNMQPQQPMQINVDPNAQPHATEIEQPLQRSEPDPQLAQFKGYVDWMLTLARKGANAELYAEVIIDNLGPEMAYAWISDPQGQQVLMQNFPEINEHAEWFRALGVAIDELTKGEDNHGDEETPLQPDGNVSSHDSAAEISPASSIIEGEAEHVPSLDGNSERASGDQSNAATNVESGDTSENGHTY